MFLFLKQSSIPLRAILAKSGEITPPYGVPVVDDGYFPLTPALMASLKPLKAIFGLKSIERNILSRTQKPG
jgi:hypothetical protein